MESASVIKVFSLNMEYVETIHVSRKFDIGKKHKKLTNKK